VTLWCLNKCMNGQGFIHEHKRESLQHHVLWPSPCPALFPLQHQAQQCCNTGVVIVCVITVLFVVQERNLIAYSMSCGASLLYNTIFPKHKERLNTKMSELVKSIAKVDIPSYRKHFDVVVACEDDDEEDMDVPLVSIYFR
jgi:hypothetical protein